MVSETDAWWLGQDSERIMALAGWIGEHPTTGADVAHLLLHPLGDGAAAKVRQLADALGLARAGTGAMVDVPPDTAWATIDDAAEGRSVWLHYGDSAWIHRPVTPDWEAAAAGQRFVILTAGVDGLHVRSLRDVDRYIARAHRLYTGKVRVA